MRTAGGGVSLLALMTISTLLVGATRVLLEIHSGTLSPAEVLFIYLPRYFLIAAAILAGGFIYEWLQRDEHPVPVITAETPHTLVVTKGSAKVVLPVDDIIYISASGNYLDIVTRDQTYLMRGTLKVIEGQLERDQFVRIHRSHLVRLDAIATASRNEMVVRLCNGMTLRIGESYLHNLPHFPARKRGNKE